MHPKLILVSIHSHAVQDASCINAIPCREVWPSSPLHLSKASTTSHPYFSLTVSPREDHPYPVITPSPISFFPSNLSHYSLFYHIPSPLLSLTMAACGSFTSLFDTPMPEKPTLMESLSWSHQAKAKMPIEPHSITEIFGELHFREKPEPMMTPDRTLNLIFEEKKSNASLDSLLGACPKNGGGGGGSGSGVFSPAKNSESLQLCTEGLGSESSDDIEDLLSEPDNDWKVKEEMKGGHGYLSSYSDVRSRIGGRGFPPPIPSIGRGGKPWVCFKSYREGGRFVLREIRIPTQEFLHASREDGRLKLHFVHPDTDIAEEEEEGSEEEQDQEVGVRGECNSE